MAKWIKWMTMARHEIYSSEKILILVVEDEAIVRMTVTSILNDAGYEIAEAGSAGEALAQLEAGLKPDLLFTDMMMPGSVSVDALIAYMQDHQPGVPIILSSGYNIHNKDDQYPNKLWTNFLNKPYRPNELKNKISEVLAEKAS